MPAMPPTRSPILVAFVVALDATFVTGILAVQLA